MQKTSQYTTANHVIPVLQAVYALPKDELASMAELLVNLTSFKRKISMQTETVGGPIDVAVISKGDGFILDKTIYSKIRTKSVILFQLLPRRIRKGRLTMNTPKMLLN